MVLRSEKAMFRSQRESPGFPFYLLIFYIIAEYAKPAFLSPFRPALLAQILLIYHLSFYKEKVALSFKIKFFKYYLYLLALMIIHIFFAANNYWAFMTFRLMVTYLLVGISFCVFIDTYDKYLLFMKTFIVIIAICAVDRVIGLGIVGTAGSIGDENDFALAMNVFFPISFFLSRSAKSWKKGMLLVASLLFVLGNIVSASRGGLLGLVAVGGCCWLFSKHKFKTLIIALLLAFIGWNFATPQFKAEVAGISAESAESDTGQDRIELWKVSWRAFKDNPIIGVGQGNMPAVMEIYQYDEYGRSFWQRGLWGRAIHSIYFTLLPELGLVGIFLISMLLKELLKTFRQTGKISRKIDRDSGTSELEDLNTSLFVAILGYMATGIFLSALYYPEFWNISALAITLYMVVRGSALQVKE